MKLSQVFLAIIIVGGIYYGEAKAQQSDLDLQRLQSDQTAINNDLADIASRNAEIQSIIKDPDAQQSIADNPTLNAEVQSIQNVQVNPVSQQANQQINVGG